MMLYRVVASLLLPVVVLYILGGAHASASSIELQDYNYMYSIVGSYRGVLEARFSGKFKALFAGSGGYTSGYLKISYEFSLFLTLLFSPNTYTIIYGYRLENYTLNHRDLSGSFVERLEAFLSKELNKTRVELSEIVNPRILLTINLWSFSVNFTDFIDFYRNSSAILIVDDVICFSLSKYSEERSNDYVYKEIVAAYYDVMTGTPLYFYRYRSFSDSLNESNYFSIKEVLVTEDIGPKLAKLLHSRTEIISFVNGESGRIGAIALGGRPDLNITWSGSKVFIEVNVAKPYRLVAALDKSVSVSSSSIKLNSYSFRALNVYLSDVITNGSRYEICFDRNIAEVREQSVNASFIHEITIEDKSRSPPLSAIYITIAVNAVLVYITFWISRAVANIVKRLS